MWRFILITFAFLAFAFYEMSGGADFDPIETRMARIELPVEVEEEKLDTVVVEAPAPTLPENVTRVSLNLSSVGDVVRPTRTVRTVPARQLDTADNATDVALSEEEPTIILPSLITGEAVITPVDFGADPEPQINQAGAAEVRFVSGNSVNVRGGPGTNYSVVNRLSRGDEVIILQDPGEGWVKLRPASGGTVGWMADFLLSEG